MWQRFLQYAGVEKCLIGASMFRIIGGFAIIIQYLLNYKQRHYLYGPTGVWPYEYFRQTVHASGSFSIYAWNSSPLFFELVFHLGIVVAFLWMIGFKTRLLTFLNYVFWWSMHERCPGIWDGGDNLMQLVLVYALFANVGAHFSVDPTRPSPSPLRRQVLAMLHNSAILAFALQICLVYGIAGLTKVQGESWRDGTAIYYALRGGEFVWPGVSEHIYQSRWSVLALSYATVAFQVSFPFLVFLNRYTRNLAIACGLLFHLGIGLVMGLITFALFLIAADLALVGDAEYRAIGNLVLRVVRRRSQAIRALVPSLRSVGVGAHEGRGEAVQVTEAERSET